jgi:methyl-accepting chemotaxis protein
MEMLDDVTDISEQTAYEADVVADTAEAQTDSIGKVSSSATELRARTEELEEVLDRFSVSADRTPDLQTDTAHAEVDD